MLPLIRRSHLRPWEAEMVIFFMWSVIKQYSPAGILSLKSEMLNRVMALIIKGHLLVAEDNVKDIINDMLLWSLIEGWIRERISWSETSRFRRIILSWQTNIFEAPANFVLLKKKRERVQQRWCIICKTWYRHDFYYLVFRGVFCELFGKCFCWKTK